MLLIELRCHKITMKIWWYCAATEYMVILVEVPILYLGSITYK